MVGRLRQITSTTGAYVWTHQHKPLSRYGCAPIAGIILTARAGCFDTNQFRIRVSALGFPNRLGVGVLALLDAMPAVPTNTNRHARDAEKWIRFRA